jgi:hypothetical protein
VTARVAFVIDVLDSYGEREVALRFAAGLPPTLTPVFVTPPEIAPHFAGHETRVFRAPAEAVAAIEELAPAIVVGCEYYNLPEEVRACVDAGPWRLVTTDGTTLGVEINSNPLAAPGAERPIAIPERIVRIRNCPVNDPAEDTEHLYHWSLWPGLVRGDGAAVRREWRVAPGARLVMMALSAWAVRAAAALGLTSHYPRLVGRVVEALRATGAETELILVAPQPAPTQRAGRVTLRTVGYLAPAAYEALLLGADLVVTDNVIQLSVGKAFMAGVPTLVLVNSDPERGPVYNIFPLRVRFPETVYTRALAPVELADAGAVRERVAAALRGEARGDEGYRAALARLRTPAEIVARMGVSTS